MERFRGALAWGAAASLLGAALVIGGYTGDLRPLGDGIETPTFAPPPKSSASAAAKPPQARRKRPPRR